MNKMKSWQELLLIQREQKNFSPEKWIINKCNVFNEYLKKHNIESAVLSVSGGIDSSVTLGLLKETMKLSNSFLKKIIAVYQPINSSEWSLNNAKELCKFLDIELTVVDQTDIHKMILEKLELSGLKGNRFTEGMLKSYMRTPINYAISQILSQSFGYKSIVIGTGNKDEDGYMGYFCKYGDGAVDLQLISDLHKSEVFSVAKQLNIPECIINTKPSADLWSGQSDEEEMGVSYDFIEFYTSNISTNITEILCPESLLEYNIYKNKCDTIHNNNKHKFNGIINL